MTDGWQGGVTGSVAAVQSIAGAAAVDCSRASSDRDGGAHGRGACLLATLRRGGLASLWLVCPWAGKAVSRATVQTWRSCANSIASKNCHNSRDSRDAAYFPPERQVMRNTSRMAGGPAGRAREVGALTVVVE